jgi:putative nucleotidyltransferase with HDIG domain
MKKKKNKKTISNRLASGYYVSWFILAGVTACLIFIIYPGLFLTQHAYQVGDIAEKNIKARENLFIEDLSATQVNKKLAAESILSVYDHDPSFERNLTRQIIEAFDEMRGILESDTEDGSISIHDKIMKKKQWFESKIGITVSDGAYKILVNEKFSDDISNNISMILLTILGNGVVSDKEILFDESNKGITLRNIGTNMERTVFNLKQTYGLDQARTMVRIVGQPILKNANYILLNLIVDFCQRLIQPNITFNKIETEKRKQQAVSEVKTVLYMIKEGEMLLREGERISDLHLLKLKAIGNKTQKDQLILNSIGAVVIILSLLIITYKLQINNRIRVNRNYNKNLLFLSVVLIFFLIVAVFSSNFSELLSQNLPFSISGSSVIFGAPLAAGAMMVCLFMGADIAVAFSLAFSICAAIALNNRFEIFIYFFFSSAMAAHWIQSSRKRRGLIRTGFKVGMLNILIVAAIDAYLPGFVLVKFLWDCVFAFLGGISAGIVATGIVPILEVAFNYVTDIKLLELANLEQPLLRRLMIEAPGTYYHSIVVGSMVEAAASEIGVNPLFAKVCGYYHDIGKIKKPLYFIENQANGKNRHDKLAPSMSSLILMSHIKDGVEIAKDNKLGDIIVDTIRQHHGTNLISFFYDKAQKQKGQGSIAIEDYKYPGPKPQTRVTGLVMLADVLEAASRTLDNPTPSRIKGHVQNVINKIFTDGELDECELTLKDLHKIAKSFNQILNGIYHHRIDYPETTALKNEKQQGGSSDKQSAKPDKDISKKDTEKSPGGLKRLGMS